MGLSYSPLQIFIQLNSLCLVLSQYNFLQLSVRDGRTNYPFTSLYLRCKDLQVNFCCIILTNVKIHGFVLVICVSLGNTLKKHDGNLALTWGGYRTLDRMCNVTSVHQACAVRITNIGEKAQNRIEEIPVVHEFLKFLNQQENDIEMIALNMIKRRSHNRGVLDYLLNNLQDPNFPAFSTFPMTLGKYSRLYQSWILENVGRIQWILCHYARIENKVNVSCGQSEFVCLDGSCISPKYRCNQDNECLQGEDEKNCPPVCWIHGHSKLLQEECNASVCSWTNCRCGMLYVYTDTHGCMNVAELQIYKTNQAQNVLLNINEKDVFECQDGQRINTSLIDDLGPDCSSQEDENKYRLLLLRKRFNPSGNFSTSCPVWGHIPCVKGHPNCFPKEKLCVVDYDAHGHLKYCRNGLHLLHCEYIGCIGMFKCPDLYCLPVHLVCNGIEECPYGEDETKCDLPLSCPGMFRCKAGFCVSREYICDSIP